MKAKLGDLSSLQAIRDSLIRDKVSEDRSRLRLEQERWEAFQKTVQGIAESVQNQDLSELVSGVRRMKNLLRRPSVKKDLARMEASDSGADKEEKKKGSCKCAQCGETIDGYNDCIKGALCVKCAMKDREAPAGENEKDKSEKDAKKGVAFPPEMIGGGMEQPGAPEDQAVTNPGPNDQTDTGDEEEQFPKAKKDKLRKKGLKAQKQESDEFSVRTRRGREGLRKRDYDKWQI